MFFRQFLGHRYVIARQCICLGYALAKELLCDCWGVARISWAIGNVLLG